MMMSSKNREMIMRKIMPALMPLIAMYMIWCVLSLVAVHGGGVLNGSSQFNKLILPVCIGLYIFLALFISQIFMVYVDDVLNDMPVMRGLMLVGCLSVGLFIYKIMGDGSVKSLFLSSLGTANLIVFACLIATWMVHPLQRPSELVPVCCVFALADLFSVFAGPTRHMVKGLTAYYEKGMQGPPPLTDFILVKISVPGIDVAVPLFGVSDWVILVFLCSAFAKFNLNDNLAGAGIRTMIRRKRLSFYFPAASLGLLVSITTAQLTGFFLPALPFVACVFLVHGLIFHPQVRRLNRREWALLSGFSSVLIFLLVAGILMKA